MREVFTTFDSIVAFWQLTCGLTASSKHKKHSNNYLWLLIKLKRGFALAGDNLIGMKISRKRIITENDVGSSNFGSLIWEVISFHWYIDQVLSIISGIKKKSGHTSPFQRERRFGTSIRSTYKVVIGNMRSQNTCTRTLQKYLVEKRSTKRRRKEEKHDLCWCYLVQK